MGRGVRKSGVKPGRVQGAAFADMIGVGLSTVDVCSRWRLGAHWRVGGLARGSRVFFRSDGEGKVSSAVPAGADGVPRVGIIMGSKTDWPTMQLASELLSEFGVNHERLVVSAHRTPERMFAYARDASDRGIQVIIAGAGGAAHLPGMVASMTTLPVLGVPIKSRALSGLDSLLSIVQMPGGVPVGTLAIGDSGAKNAALMAIRILALQDTALTEKLRDFHQQQADAAIVDLVDSVDSDD